MAALGAIPLAIVMACTSPPAPVPRAPLAGETARAQVPPAPAPERTDLAPLPPQPGTWPATMTDAYIMAFVQAAHVSERQQAELARQRATYGPVKAYADRMAREHGSMQQAGEGVLTALALQPAFSPRSQNLLAQHTATMDQLQQKIGAGFDAAYLEHNIRLHEHILQKLEQAGQEARHPDVKRLLDQAKPELKAHLADAQGLQRSLLNGRLSLQ